MSSEGLNIRSDHLSLGLHPYLGGNIGPLVHRSSGRVILTAPPEPDSSGWSMGGCAFLFPFAGRSYDAHDRLGHYDWNGHRFRMGIHGFAYGRRWDVSQLAPDEAVMTLEDDPESIATYPFHFRIANTYRLSGTALRISSSIENCTPNTPMPMSPGWHPFFCLGNGSATLWLGCKQAWQVDSLGLAGDQFQLDETITVTEESPCSLIVETSEPEHAIDIGGGVRLLLQFDRSQQFTVLWKPADAGFICVEPWTRLPAAARDRGVIMLEPGQQFRSSWTIEVQESAS